MSSLLDGFLSFIRALDSAMTMGIVDFFEFHVGGHSGAVWGFGRPGCCKWLGIFE